MEDKQQLILDVPFKIVLDSDADFDGVNMLDPESIVDPGFKLTVDTEVPDRRTRLIHWRLLRTDGAPFKVRGFSVEASVPAIDLHRMWVPVLNESIGKSDLISLPWGISSRTFASWSFPFIAALSRQDVNRFAMGFMDHVNLAEATHSCYDEDARIGLKRLYEEGPLETNLWEETLYVSRIPNHLFDQIRHFTRNYDRIHQHQLCETPPAAWKPVWCTWYGIKENITADYVLENIPHLVEMGFGSVILDAGWWIDGYVEEATGHYKANEKFSDMKGMAKRLQKEGLRLLLWCGPLYRLDKIRDHPFIAEYLQKSDYLGEDDLFLCPRCQPVHDYVAGMVEHLMQEYGIDGLKIDFIDAFEDRLSYPCQAGHEHAYATYGEVMHALLRTLHASAKVVRSDALLEFRMNYSNLITRSYATNHRAQDSPLDFDHIRRMCTRLRSYMMDPEAGREGNVAVHADPAWWQPHERAENVACFMSSLVTSAVPMLSTDLRALEGEHRQIVKAWLEFYNQNTDLLMFGRHRVLSTDPHHSIFSIHRDAGAVIGLYTNTLPGRLEVPDVGVQRIWIVNGSAQNHLFARLDGLPQGDVTVKRYGRTLRLQESSNLPVTSGAVLLDMPLEVGGALEVLIS